MPLISGSFTVAAKPMDADPRAEASSLGRLSLDKTFSGTLEAVSVGQMLSYRSSIEGSAGYVAIELVAGSIDGKVGSFALQHCGHANRGTQSLSVDVIADSGTGDLTGLSGSMRIVVGDGGEHSYEFDYTLPA